MDARSPSPPAAAAASRSGSWSSTAATSGRSPPRAATTWPTGRAARRRSSVEFGTVVSGPQAARRRNRGEDRMNRKWLAWIVVPALLTFMYGCPKKKPKTPPPDLNVETTTVPPPTPAATPAPTDVAPPATPPAVDKKEDPLLSSDLQVVNEELRRRGFRPDVYFDYDETTLP